MHYSLHNIICVTGQWAIFRCLSSQQNAHTDIDTYFNLEIMQNTTTTFSIHMKNITDFPYFNI